MVGASSFFAHGGTAGLVLEIAFLLLPIVVFLVLAWWSARRSKRGPGGLPGGAERE